MCIEKTNAAMLNKYFSPHRRIVRYKLLTLGMLIYYFVTHLRKYTAVYYYKVIHVVEI